MKKYNPTYKKFGENSILVEWPSKIDPEVMQDVVSFEKLVSKEQKVKETIIAYNSLTIQYQHLHNYSLHYKYRDSFSRVVDRLKELYGMDRSLDMQKQKVWNIPVCYDRRFGLDLEEIAQLKGITVEEVIQLHASNNYLIYFLGFQPGFLYLGGLNEKIHVPRRANPRLRVQKGSVGIGGEQTGIYPQDSSGGWNLIGKSPIDFFDISKPKPCFAKAGDVIQFHPISLEMYFEIEMETSKGVYQIENI